MRHARHATGSFPPALDSLIFPASTLNCRPIAISACADNHPISLTTVSLQGFQHSFPDRREPNSRLGSTPA